MNKTIIYIRAIVGFGILIFLFIDNYQIGLLGVLIFIRTWDQNDMIRNHLKQLLEHLGKKIDNKK